MYTKQGSRSNVYSCSLPQIVKEGTTHLIQSVFALLAVVAAAGNSGWVLLYKDREATAHVRRAARIGY